MLISGVLKVIFTIYRNTISAETNFRSGFKIYLRFLVMVFLAISMKQMML